MLLRIATLHADNAHRTPDAHLDHSVIAITFAALSIEALANAIGDRVIVDWNDFESANPYAKLRILADHLDIPMKAGTEPWGTVRWLGRFRNLIAHAKPERVIDEHLLDEKEYQAGAVRVPASKLEKIITVENARRAVHAVGRLKDILCAKVSPEKALGLYNDAWTGSTRRAESD